MVGVVITASGSQKHWDFILCNFKPDQVYVYGEASSVASTVLSLATSIASPSDLPQDHAIVLLAPTNGEFIQGETSLCDFAHPENAIYWFGSDANHIQAEVFTDREADHKVYIPTDTIDQMYAAAAWSVVAWDRRCKAA